jgi:hypothetical protein
LPELIEVRFKGNRKAYFTCEPDAQLKRETSLSANAGWDATDAPSPR